MRVRVDLVSIALLVALCASPPAAAQAAEAGARVKLWVFLADKGHADAGAEATAVAALADEFPARARARRALRRTLPGLLDARDLPVAHAYLAQLEVLGVELHVTSRWLNAVSVTADAGQLARIEGLPFVTGTRPVGRSIAPALRASQVDAAGAVGGAHAVDAVGAGPGDGGSAYGWAQTQVEQLDLDALHALGHTGQGVVIGVLDSGFRTTHAAFHDPAHALDVLAAWDFVDGDAEVGPEAGDDPDQHAHGTFVLGELAAYLPGELVGAAYDAAYILCKTEDITDETPAEEDFYVAGLEFIELNGGDVATSSLGYIDWYDQSELDGHTAVTTLAVNLATANGLHCCTAAGNSGNDLDPGTSALIAPADALSVLTVGSVDSSGAASSFSSDGPSADGRVKPEVMALGEFAISVWAYDDVNYGAADGTSAATPLVAGVVACLAGAHPEWSVPTLRERVLKSAAFGGGPIPDPSFVYGYGIVDADGALSIAGSWTSLPGGAPGVAGLPALAGAGALVGGEPVSLLLSGGKPFATALLVVGFAQINVPFKGGLLVPAVNLLLPGLPLDAAGAATLGAIWPAGLPSGVSVYFQIWLPDPAGPAGFAGSNGLRATTP